MGIKLSVYGYEGCDFEDQASETGTDAGKQSGLMQSVHQAIG